MGGIGEAVILPEPNLTGDWKTDMTTTSKRRKKRKLSREDFQFLKGTDLFSAVPEKGKNQLMACLAPMTIRAGERFIRRGRMLTAFI